jgi:hypothetical protein
MERSRNRLCAISIFGVVLAALLLTLLGTHAQETASSMPVARDEALVNQQLPLLCKMTRGNPVAYQALLDYATCVLKPEWIKTEDDLLSLFSQKNGLIRQLLAFCNTTGGINGPTLDEKFWPAIEEELRLLGIQAIFTEDYIGGLSDGPFSMDIIDPVASEPFRLLVQLKNLRTESYNGEYIYRALDTQMVLVEIGERFLRSYAESRYSSEVRDILYEALIPLTDIHSVGPGAYVVGGTSKEAYPGATSIENHRRFLESYPESRFHDVVARIIDHMSDSSGEGPIYAVVTDACPSEDAACKVVFSYLLQGVDIPHILRDPTEAETRYVVYRFYSDKTKAEQALAAIRKIKPQALIRIF